MPTWDQERAECRIFTFKEGLLSAVAHDLELDVTRFTVTVSDAMDAVEAEFEVGSIRVLGAVVDGSLSAGTLSEKDKRKIEDNLVKDVIGKRHPTVRFRSTSASTSEVRGTLEIAGRTRDIRLPVKQDGDAYSAEIVLHQPDFGIKPFSAMLGALKIKPDVKVRIRVPK